MAEPVQFAFDLREATTALLKHQGIHEGLWMVGFEFAFAAGIIGGQAGELKPGAIVQIIKVQLVKQTEQPEGSPLTPLIVNAAEVNPALPPKSQRPSK